MAMTDRLTYQLYQETGCYGQRWWTLQGTQGGHRFNLTNTEKKALGVSLNKQGQVVPYAGDLPYAPFDQRTIAAIGSIEQVSIWHSVALNAEYQERKWDRAERAGAEDARRLLAQWLDRQWSETWDVHRGVYKQTLRAIKERTGAMPSQQTSATADDLAQLDEQYVHAGT